MASKQNHENKDDSESEVWNAIAAFEKILEAIPDDRSSLETLFHAYEHIGDRVRSLDCLLRLAGVVVAKRDMETAPLIITKLAEYGPSDPRVAECSQRLHLMSDGTPGELSPAPQVAEPDPLTHKAAASSSGRFRVADELTFAWKLFEAGEITQEEYALVAQDLADLSIDGHLSTVSVLHALDGRAFSGMERVLGFISREANTPIISLQSFELQQVAAALLPRVFTIRRGALVFDLLKDDALVVVMNPFDQTLRADVVKVTGRDCHFFMTPPRDFDAAVATLPGD